MDEKKKYLSASGYNLHGSTYSINIPTGGVINAGYRGSNEFICEYFRHFSTFCFRAWKKTLPGLKK